VVLLIQANLVVSFLLLLFSYVYSLFLSLLEISSLYLVQELRRASLGLEREAHART